MSTSTTLSDNDADEPDDEDDVECACEYGFPGCIEHWLENDGYGGGDRE